MSTQKAKFELFARLQALGFTYEEAAQLRRIEITLHRWAEAECNGAIERDEKTGAPRRVYEPPYMRDPRYPNVPPMRQSYPIADREAGALKRLKFTVDSRNHRLGGNAGKSWGNYLVPYHQTDPRGCALYLVKRSEIPAGETLDCCYNRGLAVCA